MLKLRLGDGVREGRQAFSDATRLVREHLAATLLLGLVFALLPAFLRAFLLARHYTGLLAQWSVWVQALFSGGARSRTLLEMVTLTLRQSGQTTLPLVLSGLVASVLSPFLLSTQALLYNGRVPVPLRGNQAVQAVRTTWHHLRTLLYVALACIIAEWLVRMVPSIASGILSLLTEMLAWIPILGTIVSVLSVLLSVLVSLLTDFAVIVLFCYVWICATCEDVPGFGAVVRSWQITRNQMHRTIFSLLSLMLFRLGLIALLGLVWLLALRPLGVPAAFAVYAACAAQAVYTVLLGALTSGLYQRRPLSGGPQPGQFRGGGPDLGGMKRANL